MEIKAGTKLVVCGQNVTVLKVVRTGVQVQIEEPGKERQVTISFDQIEKGTPR